MMEEGEEQCLAKSDKAFVVSVWQGFHCMMEEKEKRYLARATKLMLLLCCRASIA